MTACIDPSRSADAVRPSVASAEIPALVSRLAIESERRLAARLAPLGLRPAQFRLLHAVRCEAQWRLCNRAALGIDAARAKAVPHDRVLQLLGDVGASSLKAALTDLPVGTLTNDRQQDRDRRRRRLRLTAAGERLADLAGGEAERVGAELAAGLSDADRDTLNRLVSAVR